MDIGVYINQGNNDHKKDKKQGNNECCGDKNRGNNVDVWDVLQGYGT